MKLVTYDANGVNRLGAVVDGKVYRLDACMRASGKGDPTVARNMMDFLAAGASALKEAQAAVDWAKKEGTGRLARPLARVKLRAPLPHPNKLFCLAGNYAAHIQEGGKQYVGKEKMIPRFFMKPVTTIIATGDPIRVPPSCAFADWELELAVVIGKEGRDIKAREAGKYIAGYTIFNDVSARELTFRQKLPQQEGDAFFDWLVGKWLDSFGPMGPWLVTADEIPNPDRLEMKLYVNGELQQHGNSGQMIFSPAEVIEFISQFVTLQPGDIISTGTPSGVGHAKGIRLKPGDVVRGEIEGIGVLENTVVAL